MVRSIAVSIALLALGGIGLAQTEPFFRGIGVLPGPTVQSLVHAVSGDGQVVFGQSYGGIVRWREGVLALLPMVSPGQLYQVNDVNHDGSVIVGHGASGTEVGAFRWTETGGLTILGHLGPWTWPSGTAFGVSGDGGVVVGTDTSIIAPFVSEDFAFRWTPGSGMTALVATSPSSALGISRDGMTIVGKGGLFPNWKWTETTGFKPLALNVTYHRVVSADGTVVLGSLLPSYALARQIEGIPDPVPLTNHQGGHIFAVPLGMSYDGRVVIAGTSGEQFVWDPEFKLRSLQQELVSAGLDTTGWEHLAIVDISGDGRTLVGNGFHPVGIGGWWEGWIAYLGGDRDGDSLFDHWEVNGLDANGDGIIDLDLPALGADPDHKDLFVEVDAMAGLAPVAGALSDVAQAFADSPVGGNPSMKSGIRLHILTDETDLPAEDWPTLSDGWPVRFDMVKELRFGTPAERADPNWANIKEARRRVYRYCIFARTTGTGDDTRKSGKGEVHGNDFMVTLGHPDWSIAPHSYPGNFTRDLQAATFMHELGHTLGLHHGGADDIRFKPNYYSVMNYTWQYPADGYWDVWRLDYSEFELPPLDEADLDETAGITPPSGPAAYAAVRAPYSVSEFPGGTTYSKAWAMLTRGLCVDWNRTAGCEAHNPALPIAVDVNWLDHEALFHNPFPEVLRGHNDWANLILNFRIAPDYADGLHASAASLVELDVDTYHAISAGLPPICYPDCDLEGQLNVNDFICFQTKFALGDPYADCDGNGVRNVNDYICFQTSFALGC